ncbi:MAG: response regulator transcription factor [Cyclobacteriaceae bacterium]
MEKIKVLISDDHQIVLDGFKLLLSQQEFIEIVGEALDGEEVIEKVKKAEELDIVILDINVPKKDGIEVTKELKTTYPEIKILVVTMYNRKEFIKNLMEAGVDGYVLKNSGKAELIAAIESLAKGEPYYGKDITRTIIKSYQKNKVFDSPLEIDITEREKEIIRLISEGLNTSQIAERLFLSGHTVNTHRKNILSKLNVKNSAGVIRFGIQTGIIKGFDF